MLSLNKNDDINPSYNYNTFASSFVGQGKLDIVTLKHNLMPSFEDFKRNVLKIQK